MEHVVFKVKYEEVENGTTNDVWYEYFNTKEDALEAVKKEMKYLPDSQPDWYIIAEYIGEEYV